MSIEEINTDSIYDRAQLQQLTPSQLASLLGINQTKIETGQFTKDNLIEMVLNGTEFEP